MEHYWKRRFGSFVSFVLRRIESAIPKKIDTNTPPVKGDAITKKDMAMAKAPAPMLNPLAQRGRLIFFYVFSCP